MTIEFEAWPKISRTNPLLVTITEKINGTNACVAINENTEEIVAQSRNRIITPDNDNYGFAKWVETNKEDLYINLGDGHHFGEWAGLGIQKNPNKLDRKKFFLFNTYRWGVDRPKCCDVVPILYTGELGANTVEVLLEGLVKEGSMIGGEAEGVVVYSHAHNSYTKCTIGCNEGKWGK